MNAGALPAAQLACLLYDAAEGIYADVAAVMLTGRHGHFLHDPAFRRIIAAGSSITTGQPLAVIRWQAAIRLRARLVELSVAWCSRWGLRCQLAIAARDRQVQSSA